MLSDTLTKSAAYEWQSLTRAVEKAFHESDFSKAEDLCWEVLSKAKTMGEFEPRLAISLSNLAVIHRTRGQLDRAEDLSNIALRILKAVDSRGELMVKALLNSACFFHEQGRWGEARRLYSKAIALLENSDQESLLGRALCLYARLCSDQARYSQAETLLKRVASMEPEEAQQRLLYLFTVVQNSIRQERLNRAEQALAESDQVLSQRTHLHLLWKSSLLSLRGDLMAEQHQAAQRVSGSIDSDFAARREAVVEAYEHALEIREQVVGPYHGACGELFRKQAAFSFQISDYGPCEEQLRRALSICLAAKGPYHLETLRCLELSALVLRATGRHSEAEDMEERSRQVERRVRELARETYVVWGEPDAH